MDLRRSLCRALAALPLAATFAAAPLAAHAQGADAWPSKPVRIVVPFAAGGTSDVLARMIAEKLSGALKQNVVVENKAGAGGVIGADAVAKSAPDGHVLLLGTIATHAINPALLPKMPYDAGRDFAPVVLVGTIPNVLLVNADQPMKSVRDVIAAARARPGTLQFASAGQGTSQHLSGEVFRLLAGVDIVHVPYKGSAPAIQDVMAGHVPMSFETSLVAAPQLGSGKLRALAVTTAKRAKMLPDVPTMAEAGVPGFDVASWQALYAPAGTPPAIVARLNAEIERILDLPDVKAKLDALGVDHADNTPEQFAAFQRSELARWTKVVRDGNVKP